MTTGPCERNCPDRAVTRIDGKTVACHSYCKAYIDFRGERDKMLKDNFIQKQTHWAIEDSIRRMKNRPFGHYRKEKFR